MTTNRHGASVAEFPSELEIVTTRKFEAPLKLVWDVLTQPEHVRNWFAPFDDRVTECSIDLRVGGSWRIVIVGPDGDECVFRGSYSEVEPPTRTVSSWLFEGWPDAWADRTTELREDDGVTTLTATMRFRDAAGRAHMTSTAGPQDSWNKLEDYLRTLVESQD
ncbi:MAG TPA: SRPBCC domain-containing protein [Gaiellaceae bacterium]|nr:SRPBCC domain-containing protein [Gaiellaceae bacterium]